MSSIEKQHAAPAKAALDAYTKFAGTSGDEASDIQDLIVALMFLTEQNKKDPYQEIKVCISNFAVQRALDSLMPVQVELSVKLLITENEKTKAYGGAWKTLFLKD